MKLLAYLLLIVMGAAQVDDTWAVEPVSSTASFADVDDAYLPVQRRLDQEEAASPRQTRAVVGLVPPSAPFPPFRGGAPLQRNLTAPSAPLPLYLLVSLQI
jgi:hypothetical protein